MFSDRGVSETIGAVMLISVVVVAVAIFGVVLTSQGTPQNIPALDAVISNVDRTVFVYHDGGDTLSRQDMYILVNGEKQDFSKNGDPGWTTWSTGETLSYQVPGTDPVTSIRVVYDNSAASATLSSADFGPSGMPTATPTPTPTTPVAPVADFTGTPTSGTAPLIVTFTDASANTPDTWSWDFGDSTPVSPLQNPVHEYAGAGTYTVALTVSNAVGSDTETKIGYITAGIAPPVADFSGIPTSGNAPLTVTFTDTSAYSPTSWLWDFGDGDSTNSTVQNPVHTYASAATYSVTLTATNAGGSDDETKTNYITASLPPAPVADFTGTPTSGTRPLTVVFTDTSTNTPTSWLWVFGDGDSTNSTVQNPVHTYATAGTYTVALLATNAGGSDSESKIGYITASLPPRSTIFYDGFEVSRPSGNGWTETGSVDWGTSYPRIGTRSVRMRGGGTAETIYRTISTAGYSQIIASVYLGASSLDSSSEYVEAQYSTDGGGSWTRFGAILNGDAWEDGQLHSFTSVELPASADNNPNFRIRLRIVASATNDYGYFDEVLVTGIPN